MKDGMEQESAWRQNSVHSRSVGKGEGPELGQWWAERHRCLGISN